jgi:hypothetical protein
MSVWTCPHCKTDHDYGSNPDVLDGLPANGKTSFECDCGCSFEMWVDFDPIFTIDKSTIKLPEFGITDPAWKRQLGVET